MIENRLQFLITEFPNHKVHISGDGLHAVVVNPFYEENVNVYYHKEDDYTPFVVSFSFQHCHLADEEDVVDWINKIITGKKLAIEFFKNGRSRFGGDISAAEFDEITYEKLEQYTGYFGITKLLELVDSFKVRGWNIESNLHADFVLENDGSITIAKHIAN